MPPDVRDAPYSAPVASNQKEASRSRMQPPLQIGGNCLPRPGCGRSLWTTTPAAAQGVTHKLFFAVRFLGPRWPVFFSGKSRSFKMARPANFSGKVRSRGSGRLPIFPRFLRKRD